MCVVSVPRREKEKSVCGVVGREKAQLTMRHIVDTIQVFLVLLVVHVLTPGAYDLDGIMTEKHLTGRPVTRRREVTLHKG